MSKSEWSSLIEQLASRGIAFDAALTDAEIARAEANYGVSFPEDLRGFLQTALPTGDHFPNWRLADDPFIRKILRWPLEGICFDIEHNVFWLPEWGAKPENLGDAKRIAEEFVNQAPRLIPIYSHRMIPDRPAEPGNPVLSVYQTDIIYYGFDLDDYFRHEFAIEGRKEWPLKIRQIDFWDIDRWQNING